MIIYMYITIYMYIYIYICYIIIYIYNMSMEALETLVKHANKTSFCCRLSQLETNLRQVSV